MEDPMKELADIVAAVRRVIRESHYVDGTAQAAPSTEALDELENTLSVFDELSGLRAALDELRR